MSASTRVNFSHCRMDPFLYSTGFRALSIAAGTGPVAEGGCQAVTYLFRHLTPYTCGGLRTRSGSLLLSGFLLLGFLLLPLFRNRSRGDYDYCPKDSHENSKTEGGTYYGRVSAHL